MPRTQNDKWAPKQGETLVCAMHKLPITFAKGKRRARVSGAVKDVDAEIGACPVDVDPAKAPEGYEDGWRKCNDPHVVIGKDGVSVYVPGLVAWKRPIPADEAKANLAAYKKDPEDYLKSVVPLKQPALTLTARARQNTEKVAAGEPEAKKKGKE